VLLDELVQVVQNLPLALRQWLHGISGESFPVCSP